MAQPAPQPASSDKKSAEAKQRGIDVMCNAAGLLALSIGTCVPARAPMVLAMKGGDAASTAQTMGLMSTAAAAAELLMNPILGGLSDKYGRKPFLVMAPAVTAVLHTAVFAMPKTLSVNFMDRVISGALIFGFTTPLGAALQDLIFSKPPTMAELGQIGAAGGKLGSNFGLGFCLGPLLGSKLGGEKAFGVSAVLFALTAAYVAKNFEETLPENERKEFDPTSITPFSFVKLFQTKAMATLAATIGLSSFGEYSNIYDINFLFMKTVMGWGQQQVGLFAAAFGASQILGGRVSKAVIESAGQETYSKLGFAAYIVGFACVGSAKSAVRLGLSLFFLMFGHQRSGEASALLTAHAGAKGMGRGEVTAASANLAAALKIIAPLMYARVFAHNTSGGRNRPGSPYFLICAFLVAAQAVFMSYDRDSLKKATAK